MNNRCLFLTVNAVDFDSRVRKEAASLAKAGVEVACATIESGSVPEMEVLSARVPRHRPGPFRKVFALARLLAIGLHFLRQARAVKPAYLHFHDLSALTYLPLLLLFGPRPRATVIYDAHEWESEQSPGQKRATTVFLRQLERLLLRRVDKSITVSPSIGELYAATYGIPPPAIVMNAPLWRKVARTRKLREALDIADSAKIYLYQGALGHGRNIELLLEVFATQPDSSRAMVFMGFGALEPMVREAAARSPHIHFVGAVKPEEVLDYTSSADYGVALGEDTCPSFYYSLPNKIFEYAMAGVPMLLAPMLEFKKLAERHGIGVVIGARTVAKFREAMVALESIDGNTIKSRLEDFSRLHSWERQEEALWDVYGRLKDVRD